MRVETNFTAVFMEMVESGDCGDVRVEPYEGDQVAIEQGEQYIFIPLAEAIAFAEALKTWAEQQQ